MNDSEHHDKLVRKSLGRLFWSTPLFVFFTYTGIKVISEMEDPHPGHYLGSFSFALIFGIIMIQNIWKFNQAKKKRDTVPNQGMDPTR